jgi:spore maturation protein CgeB
MRILFAAPVTFTNITFFISQYVSGLVNAANTLGHQTKIIETTGLNDIILKNYLFKRYFSLLRKNIPSISEFPHDMLVIKKILNAVTSFHPDIVFLHLIDTYYTHLAIKKIQESGACVLNWLGVHPSIVGKGVIKILKKSDHTLIYDPSYIGYYESNLGIYNTRIVPLGCETAFYESITPDEKFKKNNQTDICFIGMFDRCREKYLRAVTDFSFGIWSWNIHDYKTDLVKHHRGVVFGNELVKVIKSSKIAINIHRDSEISGGNFRLFEIPACGTMQIVDEKKNISDFFKPGEEIVTFNEPDELKDKVRYYLLHENEREKIARAGLERVKRDHSLINRMSKIISIYKENTFH